jgi:hypothetical protein
MSVLELSGRPFTVFDPANKAHRSYYHAFVKTGSWGRCPWRFVVPEDHGDLVTMIQRSLVKYYVETEFKAVAKKQQKKVVQKTKKTVDKQPKR